MEARIKKKIIVMVFTIVILFIPLNVYATLNTSEWQPSDLTSSQDVTQIINKASVIVGVLRTGGIIIVVVALMVMGIKYMIGSVSEKAEYKKSIVPYLIGVFIIFTLSQILAIIIDIVSKIDT